MGLSIGHRSKGFMLDDVIYLLRHTDVCGDERAHSGVSRSLRLK